MSTTMSNPLILLLVITACGLSLILQQMFANLDKTLQANPKVFQDKPQRLAFLTTVKYWCYFPMAFIALGAIAYWHFNSGETEKTRKKHRLKAEALSKFDTAKIFKAPDPLSIKAENDAELILYGRDLIAHTADYLGPDGLIKPISNGMNCQNCHLDAGSKPFGNNYTAVAATYPKFRARSGTAETIYKRVNDCFQRSLNGQPLDSTSHEMKAIEAYIKWLGETVPKGKTPKGVGLMKLKYLNRAANSDSGKVVYTLKCQSCHGENGQGLPMPEGNGRVYPPLWGEKSYNEAAGLYRLSNFAGYVKANMPFGASYDNPQLTDAEAWDLAAYINSQPRPKHPFLKTDWPKIEGKPIDHPFGPFADTFPEVQHKYGPFQPIVDWQNKKKADKEGRSTPSVLK
jgi:thiosulfate dehydrogenase